MMQQPGFDGYANIYDEEFTDSLIGKYQREQVWNQLNKYLTRPLRILEVNCGTGEDAIRLAGQGHDILATDASEPMLEVGRRKVKKRNLQLEFRLLAFEELEQLPYSGSFDLIFSNFGGLNCISGDATQRLSKEFHRLLAPEGLLFLVYMSSGCTWERIYYTYKGKRQKAGRRKMEGPIQTPVAGSLVDIWYFNPEELRGKYQQYFTFVDVKPIGLMIPPSYLEEFFQKRRQILRILDKLDCWLSYSFLANYADHFAIVFSKKNESFL